MKTTPAQLEEFQKECERWLDYFQVNDWYVYYSILKIKGDYARTSVHYESRQAGIFLSDCGQIDMPLALIAKHEVIEAFVIGRLKDMALNGKYSEGEIEEETHRVVWLLSNVLKDYRSMEKSSLIKEFFYSAPGEPKAHYTTDENTVIARQGNVVQSCIDIESNDNE